MALDGTTQELNFSIVESWRKEFAQFENGRAREANRFYLSQLAKSDVTLGRGVGSGVVADSDLDALGIVPLTLRVAGEPFSRWHDAADDEGVPGEATTDADPAAARVAEKKHDGEIEFDVIEVIDSPERIGELLAWFETDPATIPYRIETARVLSRLEPNLSDEISADVWQRRVDEASLSETTLSDSATTEPTPSEVPPSEPMNDEVPASPPSDRTRLSAASESVAEDATQAWFFRPYDARLLSESESRWLTFFGVTRDLSELGIDRYAASLDLEDERTASSARPMPRFRLKLDDSVQGLADGTASVESPRSRLLLVLPRRPVRTKAPDPLPVVPFAPTAEGGNQDR